MADNKSDDKRGTNTVDAIDESRILSELERIGARTGRKTTSRAILEGNIAQSGKLLNSLLDAGRDIPEVTSSPVYQQQVPALQNRIRNIRGKMNSMDVGNQTRAESEAATLISKQFDQGTINSQAARMQPLSSTIGMAANMSNMNYDELYAKRESTLASIANRERRLTSEIPGTFGKGGQVDPEKSAMFGAEMSVVKDLIQELAAVDVAMKKLGDSAKKAGDGLGGISNSARASAYAGMFGAAGGAVQEIMVGQRLNQAKNTAGYANWENNKYDMYKGARAGDVMSQLLLSQTRESEKFGAQLFAGQQTANAAFLAGGVAQTAAGGFQVSEGIYGKVSPGGFLKSAAGFGADATNETIQGGVNIVQGVATTATVGSDIARNVSAGGADLAGRAADLEARKAILNVSAKQLQGFRDFSVGQGVAGMNMGAGAEGFIQRTTSKENLDQMIKSRVSPEQFNQMSEFGAQQIGSTFNESQVFAARGLERSGYGSMQMNMQRMSSLANAGANNPQAGLGSVLEASFSKSLEGSKVLNAMVENTAAIVQSNAIGTAAGVDTTAAAATLLAGSVGNNPNREFAAQRAATAQEVAKNITTDTSTSFTGMINTARISKTTGLGGVDAIFAAKLTTAQIRSMQAMGPAAAEEALLKQGIDTTKAKGGVKGFLDQMLVNQTSQMFTGSGGVALGSAQARQHLTEMAVGGQGYKDLSLTEKKLVGQIGSTSGLTGEEFFNTAAGLRNAKNDPNAVGKKDAALAGSAGGEMQKTLDDMRTSGFAQLSEAAKQATKDFNNAGEAIKALGELVKNIESRGDNEGDFADAGAKSAATFGRDAVVFGKAANKLDQVADKLLQVVGINNRADVSPPAIMEKLKSVTDFKHGPKGP